MIGYKLLVSLVVTTILCLLPANGDDSDSTLVTLKHGGQLNGRRITVNDKIVDQFLGVGYAKPPTGNRRFEKPEPLDLWVGVKEARSVGNACIQIKITGNLSESKYQGSEDCLYLDITVPGGVDPHSRKPVMIWLHGGGFAIGTGRSYLGAPLALHGDVIIVSINYRLNIFGFLSESLVTGNFGLWDQKAAIQWVKDNIDKFGGDPSLITLFGQSAGGASVAAQMMSEHNDGLFQRGIVQSGCIYQPWGWFNSDKKRLQQISQIKQKFLCGDLEVYECLRSKSVDTIWSTLVTAENIVINPWQPLPDGDFFSSEVNMESYNLSKKFDLMAGFNGQEGGMLLVLDIVFTTSMAVNDGISLEVTSEYLHKRCSFLISAKTPEECVDFVIKTYGLDQPIDDKERFVRLTQFLGELTFNTDMVNMLQQHSHGKTKTYAYMFTSYLKLQLENALLILPEWAKKSADHVDELPYVFGSAAFTSSVLQPLENISDPILDLLKLTNQYADDSYYSISNNVMTLWTNFAKSGNPNIPIPLQKNIPEWPEFDKESQQFMVINENMTLTRTPEKERLDELQRVLFTMIKRDLNGDSNYPAVSDLQSSTYSQQPTTNELGTNRVDDEL